MATSKEGEVLFERGKDDDSEDIWDDTALIKAYDEAISLMKMKVAEQNGLSVTDEDVLAPQSATKKKRKKARAKKGRKWKVGDRCRARFSEDQCLYEAEILSLDESLGTCFVRYTGYGNEEEVNIKDLLRAHVHKHTLLESENETDSGMDGRSGRSSQHASHSNSRPYMMPPPWGDPATSSGFQGHMFHGMPPPPQPHFPSSPGFMFMPPPPPPPAFEEMSSENSEALCSMLMSWYMSGYHTGYYQGLQKGKKSASASNPYVKR